jgi:AbrB family looped-hinge helix DNA binding protein
MHSPFRKVFRRPARIEPAKGGAADGGAAKLPPGGPAPDQMPKRWYVNGMRSTIDKAGRLVIPKALRDSLGLSPGEVEVTPDGAGLRIEPLADNRLEEEDSMLVIPATDVTVSDDLVRTLRDADQR